MIPEPVCAKATPAGPGAVGTTAALRIASARAAVNAFRLARAAARPRFMPTPLDGFRAVRAGWSPSAYHARFRFGTPLRRHRPDHTRPRSAVSGTGSHFMYERGAKWGRGRRKPHQGPRIASGTPYNGDSCFAMQVERVTMSHTI